MRHSAEGQPPERARVGQLVGRGSERAFLRHVLVDARRGQTAIVLVTGAPGAGKTALLRWVHDAAGAVGADVLRCSAYEGAPPLSPVMRLFSRLPALEAVTSRGRPPDVDVGRDGARLENLAAVLVAELLALGRRRLTVVVMDDTQELDASSQVVMEHVVVSLDDAAAAGDVNLVLVLAAREPLAPGGLAERTVRYDACHSILLQSLDEHEVYEMLAQAGLRPRPPLVAEVLEETGGLPLLVEACIERLQAQNQQRTGARLDSRVRTIADAVDARLALVDRETQRLLGIAAAVGDPWDGEELADIAGIDVEEMHACVAASQAANLVERAGDDGLRFAHPLVRAEILDRLGSRIRCTLHRLIADYLHRLHNLRPEDEHLVVRMADQLIQARPEVTSDEDRDVLLEAGRCAMRWAAWPQASRFLTAALGALPGDADRAQRAGLAFEAGLAAYYDHDPELCRVHLTQAIELAEQLGDATLQLRAATRLILARNGSGEIQVGSRPPVAELEAALRRPGAAAAPRVEGTAVLVDTLLASGETERALALVADARPAAQTAADDPEIEQAMRRLEFSEGIHHFARLELAAASACFERGLRGADLGSSPLMYVTLRSRIALLDLLRGDVRRAQVELAAMEELALDRRYWGEAGLAAMQQAACFLLTGETAATADALDRAARMYRRTGFTYVGTGLPPLAAAHAARTRGTDGSTDASSVQLGLRTPSSVAVLAAIEADDVATARAVLSTSSWRLGFRGRATMGGLIVLAAIVETGDRLGLSDLVLTGRDALQGAYDAGVVVVPGWPTTVPRLLAITARHGGDHAAARHYLDHALAVSERQGLDAEHPKALLELSRHELLHGGDAVAAGALLTRAVSGFDQQALHGWIARSEAVARELQLAPAFGSARVMVRDRTIFTNDIVGSTEANARLGDALYLEQLRKHDRIVRTAIRRNHGVEIKHTGDGVNAVFDGSLDALRCAAEVQSDFARWARAEPDVALQIRCGIARGRLMPHDGDFFGLVQSEAARLCSLASPGDVLVSAAAVAEAGAADLPMEAFGAHHLRGLPSTTEVYRLTAVGASRSGR